MKVRTTISLRFFLLIISVKMRFALPAWLAEKKKTKELRNRCYWWNFTVRCTYICKLQYQYAAPGISGDWREINFQFCRIALPSNVIEDPSPKHSHLNIQPIFLYLDCLYECMHQICFCPSCAYLFAYRTRLHEWILHCKNTSTGTGIMQCRVRQMERDIWIKR
jgi:hypothetical protein